MVNTINNVAEYDALLKENGAVFVDFYADWCGPCKMVGPVVEGISNELTNVKFVKVNVDDFPEIAQRYGIISIPTMITFKNGEQADTIVGFRPEAEIKAVINNIL